MALFNLNSMTSFSHLLGSSTKILMLIPEYYDQWVDRMQDYLNGLDEELWNCISGEINPPAIVQPIGSSSTNSEVDNQSNRLKQLEKRCMRELRGALPPVVYNYVRTCTTAKEIWNNLKDKFQGSEKTKITSVKQCPVELNDFKQKESESIEVYYDRFNKLIYRCNRYGIIRSSVEFNLIFVMRLRKEWMSVSMMVKNHQSFDTSTLNDLYNQLKSHENEVNEIVDEAMASLGGPLALISKVSEKESEKSNQVMKFFKKPFNTKNKSSDSKGSFENKSGMVEKMKEEKKDLKNGVEKMEKK
ncbi:uncharacterized protein LOC111917936 [Lactuca sativa]|uniref:uncharacterized protein LOC111917936 n=1 Tax=Lactuca sativa TaxID=4236 RepID=UPI000CD88064|nr:uncharacterized protein LOC111917936 [Lactuca sativa]